MRFKESNPEYHEYEEVVPVKCAPVCKTCGYQKEEWWHTNFIEATPELDGLI
jgi:hypothetical protein